MNMVQEKGLLSARGIDCMKKPAAIFKALGDPVRLEIINMLLGRELCVCDILGAFDVSQPTVSHHLKVLKQAGLLNDKRDGKWIYYSIKPDTFSQAAGFLRDAAERSAFSVRLRTCCENELGKGGADDE